MHLMQPFPCEGELFLNIKRYHLVSTAHHLLNATQNYCLINLLFLKDFALNFVHPYSEQCLTASYHFNMKSN